MKSLLVLSVLLGVVLSVRAAAVVPVEAAAVELGKAAPVLQEGELELAMVNSSQVPSQQCPGGWEFFQGQCYYFVSESLTWPQAQTNCAILEASLVSVLSPQEYGFLQQLSNQNGQSVAWLGGFYLQTQWLWIDGSWFANTNWCSGQFQDSSSPCLALNSDNCWINYPCFDSSYPSICVKDSDLVQTVVCPDGWEVFQGSCYYYETETMGWPEADTNCAGLEASLVSVDSPQEYDFLQQLSSNNGQTTSWLGGFYLQDQWMWIDGSWFYENFFTDLSQNSTNPCLTTYGMDGWTNFPCNSNYPSICVKNTLL